MRYMLMIYESEDAYGGPAKDGPRLGEVAASQRALARELGSVWIGGAGLAGTARAVTIRTKGGKQVVHDGPFAETKEQIGGYHIIEAENIEAAIEIARRVPLAADGAIEVRPISSKPMGSV